MNKNEKIFIKLKIENNQFKNTLRNENKGY